MPGKRKHLTLRQKIDVIKKHEKGEKCLHIAREMECGKTQIQSIVADKQNIMALWEGGCNANMKTTKVRKTTHHELNEKVFAWFCDARSKNIPLSGRLIQKKAVLLSRELGFDDFMASNGWLDRFQKRHNIAQAALTGEGTPVSEETVTDRNGRLASICEGYEPEDDADDEPGDEGETKPDEASEPIISKRTAFDYVEKLRDFALGTNNTEMFNLMNITLLQLSARTTTKANLN